MNANDDIERLRAENRALRADNAETERDEAHARVAALEKKP